MSTVVNNPLPTPVTPQNGGTGIANNSASTVTISGSFGTTFTVSNTTSVTLPTSGTLATLAGAEELTNKTLTSSVGKGTWTASGTWTLPALTFGGTVSGGGQQLNNIIIGTSTPLAGSFTTLSATVSALVGGSDATTPKITSSFSATQATAVNPSTATNNVIWGQGADSSTVGTVILLSAFGSTAAGAAPQINFSSSRGTAAAPTTTQSGDTIGRFGGRGYGASQYNTTDDAIVLMTAAETLSNTAHGANIAFAVKAIGSDTRATGLTVSANLNVVLNNAAIATNATDGFLYVATCAGTPTGTPTTNTGRVALVYDTTNHQFWIYDSGWKQPKTPAAAAIVTWQ